MSRKWIYFLAGILGAIPGALWMLQGILQSTSSTAAIGFIFLPVAGGMGALVGLFMAFAGFTILDLSKGKKEGVAWRLGLVALVAGLVALWSWRWRVEGDWLNQANEATTSSAQLEEIFSSRAWVRADAITEALAKNRNSPPTVLQALAKREDPFLLWLVGENAGSPATLVDEIAAGPIHYSSFGGVAKNPLLKRASMERFVGITRENFASDVEWRLYQTYVLANLVRRQGFPADLFDRIAAIPMPEHFLLLAIIESPHASCSLLQRFVEHENPVVRNMVNGQLAKRSCPASTS